MPDSTIDARTFTVFAGDRLVASGPLPAVVRAAKSHLEAGETDSLLIFDDQTGEQVDFDLRGSVDDAIARASPPRPRAGPGRPKLGVLSREVSLLPAHWEWLDRQSASASATLRRLVEEARRREPGKQRARAARAALDRLMTALAGNRPGYEEATRALFKGDEARFLDLIRRWPPDIRSHLTRMALRCRDLEG
jgi:uncharacterized protein